MKKTFLFLILAFISIALAYYLHAAVFTSFGIRLPFGWEGCGGDTYYGVLFLTMSCPPPGFYCPCGSNYFALALNAICYFIFLIILKAIFGRLFLRKKRSK